MTRPALVVAAAVLAVQTAALVVLAAVFARRIHRTRTVWPELWREDDQ